MKQRVRAATLALLATLVALPACASRESSSSSSSASSRQQSGQSTSNRPNDWNVVIAEQTGGADPFTEYGSNAQYQLPIHVLEPLLHVEMLPDGSQWGVVNELADKWSFPTPTTFEVEVKRGVMFQNGEELTA